jgi:hypothetical protein
MDFSFDINPLKEIVLTSKLLNDLFVHVDWWRKLCSRSTLVFSGISASQWPPNEQGYWSLGVKTTRVKDPVIPNLEPGSREHRGEGREAAG